VRVLLGGTENRQSCAGDDFVGNEKKPLTTISNRNSNGSRKLATRSEPIVSEFPIATKMHLSEEKAKSDDKTKAPRTIALRTCG
jgi:hypothetical protein